MQEKDRIGFYEVLYFRHLFFFFKQKTAYEITRDWSSDVCSSDLKEGRKYDLGGIFITQQPGFIPLADKLRWDRAWLLRNENSSEIVLPSFLRPLDECSFTLEIGRASCRERV